MRKIGPVILLVCASSVFAAAQAAAPQSQQKSAPLQQKSAPPARPPVSAPSAQAPATPATPEEIVREWFRRWNALDGTEASIKRLMDLYQPTGINQVPPSSRQIGSVYMEGQDGVRKMAEDFNKEFMSPANKVDTLFFKTQGPWGGPAVAVQYTQVATERATKKRLVLPAFAIFHIDGGKIRYARFYATPEETKAE